MTFLRSNARCAVSALAAAAVMVSLIAGCNGERREFLSMGTAPPGGTFPVVGGAISNVVNRHRGTNNWQIQPKGTKGSQENIRRLSQGGLQLGMSNAAITYFAVRGESGWDRPHDIKSIVTLAPNVALFITKADSGIKSISDLRGKRVVIGPAGAGFEMFVGPLLEEHGLSFSDFDPLNATQSAASDMLGDGTADAAFLGGAIPAASISQVSSTHNIYFIPFDEDARQRLIEKYPFFQAAVIPAKNANGDPTYRGMTEDYEGLNVGSMHLITSGDQDEELIYQITKTIWEYRDEIAQQHAAGKAINENNAARYVGTEFHPGAIRFYKEIGIWQENERESDAAAGGAEPTEVREPAADGDAAEGVEAAQGN